MKIKNKKKLSIREQIYLKDLKTASKMSPEEKLAIALELSDFCDYLRKSIVKAPGDGKSKENT